MNSPAVPQEDVIDTMQRAKRVEHDPAELDAIASEVRAETEAGSLKHFEDVLDEAHSCDANTSFVTADQREQWERDEQALLRAMKLAINDNLVPRGMRVLDYSRRGTEQGPRFRVKDREGRVFEATVEYDESIHFEGMAAFRKLVSTLTERLIAAREYYFKRQNAAEVTE